MDDMDFMKLAPCMGPAGGLIYMVTVQVMKARVGVGLESAREVLQMLAGMFALAIR
jgi:hypothetical protein